MSKRSAESQMTKDGQNMVDGSEGMSMTGAAPRATAAQLAKRKMAKPRRAAHSPALTQQPMQATQQAGNTNGSSIFGNGQATTNGMSLFGFQQPDASSSFSFTSNTQPAFNPFASTSGNASMPNGASGFSGSIFNFAAPVQPQSQENQMSDDNDENEQPGGDKKRSRPSLDGAVQKSAFSFGQPADTQPSLSSNSFFSSTPTQPTQPSLFPFSQSPQVSSNSEQSQTPHAPKFQFGQPAQTPNNVSSTPFQIGSLFSQPTTTSNIFGGLSQGASFSFGQPPEKQKDDTTSTAETPAPSQSNPSLFGQTSSASISSSLLASSPTQNIFKPSTGSSEPPQSATNLFSTTPKPQLYPGLPSVSQTTSQHTPSVFSGAASNKDTASSIFSASPNPETSAQPSAQSSGSLFGHPPTGSTSLFSPSRPSEASKPSEQSSSQPASLFSFSQPPIAQSGNLFSSALATPPSSNTAAPATPRPSNDGTSAASLFIPAQNKGFTAAPSEERPTSPNDLLAPEQVIETPSMTEVVPEPPPKSISAPPKRMPAMSTPAKPRQKGPHSTGGSVERLIPTNIPSHLTDDERYQFIAGWRLKSLDVAARSLISRRPAELDTIQKYSDHLREKILAEMCRMRRVEKDDEGNLRPKVDEPRISRAKKPLFGGSTTSTTTSRFGFSSEPGTKRKAQSDGRDDEAETLDSTKKARGNDGAAVKQHNTSETSKLFASIASGTTTTPAGSPEKSNLFARSTSQGSPAKTSLFAPSAGSSKLSSGSIFSPNTASKAPESSRDSFSETSTAGQSSFPANLFGSPAKSTAENNKSTGLTTSQPITAPKAPTSAPSFGSNNASNIFSQPPATTVSTPSIFAPQIAGSGSDSESAKSTGSAPPSFGPVSGTNFFAQFGQAAKKAEEEERKKRKLEEYDSEEETEEEWEKRDAEEQAKKRAKIAEASKAATGFKPVVSPALSAQSDSVFSHLRPGSGLSTPNAFGSLSNQNSDAEGSKTGDADNEEEEDESESEEEVVPAGPNTGRSLFDRIEMDARGQPKRDTSDSDKEKSAANIFSSGTSTPKPAATSNFFSGSTTPQANATSNLFSGTTTPKANATGNLFSSTTTPKANATSNLFSGTTTPKASTTSNIFGLTTSNTPLFGTKPADSGSSHSLFGASKPTETSPGDHTWKPDTPIKFASSTAAPSAAPNHAPPIFSFTAPSPTKPGADASKPSSLGSSLFGTPKIGSPAPSPAANPFSSLSSTGFNFGGPKAAALGAPVFASDPNSRATSPGITTGDESTAADDEPAPKDEQIDLTQSRAGEEDEDCLMEVKAKGTELVEGSDGTKAWTVRATGPLRVLKNRDTGKTRVVLRIEGSAKIGLNAALMSGMEYKLGGVGSGEGKTLVFGVATGAGKIARWSIRVGKKEDAARLRDLLEENKAN